MAVRIENKAEPLPGYTLIERIGGGGFGEVWKCEAPGGLHKAIKFVFGDLSAAGEDGQRAEQELKALSRVKTVRHPYILSLERYDILDGQLMIVMELADRNLWDRFKECRTRGLPGIPREEILGYMEETAEALDLMNSEYQLQHLDIKPQNLFLVHNHVKVADFGLVKDLEGMQASVTGGVTPVYAAPETFDGWVSRFCDQYSLAIVYQELLTGQRPFNGTNIRQLILQHLQTPPNVNPLPPGDRAAIGRALSKTPGDRFPTCRELVEALKRGEERAGGVSPLISPPKTEPALDAVAPSRLEERLRLSATADSLSDGAEPVTACLRPARHSDSNPGTTQFIRALEGTIPGGQAGELRKAPPETDGDGVLFPALVLGIGQLGMTVVQRLRHHLHQRFGGMDRLPHVRLMVLDTDPEIVRAATRGDDGARLSETDVLLASLNRPSHYLKPRDGRPDIAGWLPTRMLYRIPRSQVTTGVRALGRLAFCDNYRLITRRLQTELNVCLDPDALASALRQTNLGMRTNRVRVYLAASLGGGTGGGMFLDLAYLIRAQLKKAGYERPDVVGLFLLPTVDRNRTRTQTLGNAYAALRELSHFARPGTTFSAQHHQREPALQDAEPPFGRCIVLPLPDETDDLATRELVEEAGLFLARDLASPLGPAADLARAGQSAASWETRGLFYQTFGLYQISWPRRTVHRALARRLCHRLIQSWMSKDSKPIREAVQAWMQEQWTQQELGSSVLMERLGERSRRALGQDPEEIFRALVEPLLARHGEGRKNDEAVFPPQEIAELLAQFEQLLGKAKEDGLSETPARLPEVLRTSADGLVREWGQKLAELPVRLIEAPAFRLAGAEEAIRQMVASLEQTLQHHEPLVRDLSARAAEAHTRLQTLLSAPSARPAASGLFRKSSSAKPLSFAEARDLLRDYPKTLYQSLLLRQAGNVFLTLRGQLADEMREINFCRVRLGELARLLEQPTESPPFAPLPGKHLHPPGCADVAETLDQFEKELSGEDLSKLDALMEEMFKKQFTALVNVCVTSANVLKNVESAMLHTAEQFVAARLGERDVAEMFLAQHGDDGEVGAEIAGFFDEAAPQLSGDRSLPISELCVLSVPSGPSGERLRAAAAQALPEVEWQSAAGDEDILLYRERANLPLSDLPQLGPLAHDAYRQMSAAEHFTPHCRSDIDFCGS
jgi:serine/threonine protein kinase